MIFTIQSALLLKERAVHIKELFQNNKAFFLQTPDILAEIDDRVLLSQYRQAKAQGLSAENNLEIASLNLESDKEL